MHDLPDKQILSISGATRRGLEQLLETLWGMLNPREAG
jgi:hypothetical protein